MYFSNRLLRLTTQKTSRNITRRSHFPVLGEPFPAECFPCSRPGEDPQAHERVHAVREREQEADGPTAPAGVEQGDQQAPGGRLEGPRGRREGQALRDGQDDRRGAQEEVSR